jgi:hypothetical protein
MDLSKSARCSGNNLRHRLADGAGGLALYFKRKCSPTNEISGFVTNVIQKFSL